MTEDQLGGLDADLVQLVDEAEAVQHLCRVGKYVDSDTELPDLGGPFEHLDIDALRVQAQRRRQPRNPAADNDCFHMGSLSS